MSRITNIQNDTILRAPMVRSIEGLEPERQTSSQIKLFRGWCVDGDSQDYVVNDGFYIIDITVSGIGGLDTGVATDLQDYFIYVMKNEVDGSFGAVFSTSITYSGVVVPSGWKIMRKLNFGFVYKNDGVTNWDGIPPFHYSAGNLPFIRLTNSRAGAPFRVLSGGTSTTFAAVDLSNYIPDNARMAYLSFVNTTGEAFYRIGGTQGATGTQVGFTSGVCNLNCRTTSGRLIYYRVSGGGNLSIDLLGYWMSERA